MKEKSIVMPSLRSLGAMLAIVLGSATAALASDIELGPVGDDAPNFIWCSKDQHKAKLGQPFRLVFRGRSTTSQEETGRIHLANESNARFEWVEMLDGDPDESPRLDFTTTMAELRGQVRSLKAKESTLPGIYYLEFIGMDSNGNETLPAKGCMIEVVKELPAVEVTDLRYDPPQSGVAGQTVRMTVKNNMTASAPALQGVPWSISLVQRRPAPSGGTRFVESQVTSGMQINVPPDSTFQVTALIQMPGNRNISSADRITGRADPFNFLGENNATRANNQKSIALRINDTLVPVDSQPAHTCESGFEEVTTAGGTLGCAKISTGGAPSCNDFFDWLRGIFTGGCENRTVFRCESNSDCANGYICPQSGSNSGNCTEGHIP